MSDAAYQNLNIAPLRATINWSAVWAGVFTFMAIWSVFGALGGAIFSSAANPNAQQPISGMNVGMDIWAIVLTIIAMWVAGRVTGHLAGASIRSEGLTHGIVMFGLSVIAALIITVLGSLTLSGGTGINGTVHNPYILGLFADLGWTGFLSLFLGWLAAMGGATSGLNSFKQRPADKPNEADNIRRIRPAA
ncbi:MAG: hypothetical protein ACRD3P_17220 [Terriglobales bacterium]